MWLRASQESIHGWSWNIFGALCSNHMATRIALAAVRSNSQILNPSYTFPNTVLESKRVLLTVMSEAEALDVMEPNPGVLQCGPSLDMLGADEIRSIARARSMGNSMVPARSVALRLRSPSAPSGWLCLTRRAAGDPRARRARHCAEAAHPAPRRQCRVPGPPRPGQHKREPSRSKE